MVQDALNEIGEHLLYCPLHCEGILNEPQSGIVPRGIFLERRGGERDNAGKRCLIIGLNPGATDKQQKTAYLGMNPLTFQGVMETIFRLMPQWDYYVRLKQLVTNLSYEGDICWANLVNCECALGFDFTRIPAQTKRVCIKRFLSRVIPLFPFTAIFAVGNDSFDFCALSYPNHLVIGVPHPSRRPNFQPLVDRLQPILPQVISNLRRIEDGHGYPRAIRLTDLAGIPANEH